MRVKSLTSSFRQVQSQDGIITKEDLASYRPVYRPPVKGTYRGFDVFSMYPPSAGGVHIIQMLNIAP